MTSSTSPYRDVPVLSKASAICRRTYAKHETPQRYVEAFDPSAPGPAPQCSPKELLDAYPKVMGTIGAAVTAPVGAASGALAGGIAGAAVGSLLGPIGTVAGAVGGVVVGAASGWFGGAMGGGSLGVLLGKLLEKLHVQPAFGDPLAKETAGFSLGKLAKHVMNPKYTSQSNLSQETVDKVQSLAQPGDIIVSATDSDVTDFEPIMAALKVGGDWVHTGLYAGDGQVYEMHGSKTEEPHASRSRLTSLQTFVTRTQHVMILRPQYGSPESVQNSLDAAKSRLGEKYDFKFDLERPNKMYCVAYTYLSIKSGSPEVELAEPDHRIGHDIVTPRTFQDSPGMKEVFSTGADFPMAYWSKFD